MKRVLCRGPETLPRTKFRALGKDTLCRGLATGALGKERPSAKRPLPRVRPSSKTGPRQRCHQQIRPVGSRRPFPVKLCRGPPVRPSAKVFFFLCNQVIRQIFLKSLPRALDQALGKDFFLNQFFGQFFFYKSPLPRTRG